MTSAPAVLLIEDDAVIRDRLRLALTAAGTSAVTAASAAEGLLLLQRRSPTLVLVDLGLPDMDGFALCRSLRARSADVVIVVLTARRTELDVVAALESGADDYLFKPVRLVELTARVRAHLRRVSAGRADAPSEPIRVGDLEIDSASRTVRVGDEILGLRPREFDLLARLAEEPGRALRRDRLLTDVWGPEWEGSGKTLDVHVLAVRRWLDGSRREGPASAVPTISTVRGFGYRLDR